jgi:hypothetical protein
MLIALSPTWQAARGLGALNLLSSMTDQMASDDEKITAGSIADARQFPVE